MQDWFGRVKSVSNGMLTTENLVFEEGDVQLKWWKQAGQVIVKTVKLKPEYVGKGLFTAACRQLVAKNPEIQSLKLENVLDEGLLKKLTTRGWKTIPHDECSLMLNN